MSGRLATLCLVLAVLPPTAASALTMRVLFSSGDAAADGTRLDFFTQPVAASAKRIAFRGTTSALLTKTGNTFAAVVRTGDPLPAALGGTFNTVFAPVINDRGMIVFEATVNSSAATREMFLYDGTGFEPLGEGSPLDMNNQPEVLYATSDGVFVWNASTHTSTRVVTGGDRAPGGGILRRFGRFVLSDSSRVAFAAEEKRKGRASLPGIFAWSPASGLITVAQEDEASPIAGAPYNLRSSRHQPIAVNARGQVAFAAGFYGGAGIFLFDPSERVTTTIARTGDRVGPDSLAGIDDDYVGVDSHGDVAFVGLFPPADELGFFHDRRLVLASGGGLTALTSPIDPTTGSFVGAGHFAARLTDDGGIVWRRGDEIEGYDHGRVTVLSRTDVTPIGLGVSAADVSINNTGTVAFPASREALYVLREGRVEPVVGAGEPSPGTGTIVGLGQHRLRGNSLAFSAVQSDGGKIIALRRGSGPLERVVASGEPSPIGGVFLPLDDTPNNFSVRGRRVLFSGSVTAGTALYGLFLKDARGLTNLVKSDDVAPGGGRFMSFGSVFITGREAVFTASLEDEQEGIFATRRAERVKLAETGEPTPGAGATFFDIANVVAQRGRVLFAAGIAGAVETSGLFLWERGGVVKIVAEGEGAPEAGTVGKILDFDLIPFVPMGLGHRRAIFIVPVVTSPEASPLPGLFVRKRARARRLLLTGEPSPLGGTIILRGSKEEPISLVGATVILVADLGPGASNRSALLSVSP